MKTGITSKLFLAIFVACLLVAIAMAMAVRISFEHGFIDYLRVQEGQRDAQFVTRLELTYVQYGGWDFLKRDPQAWTLLSQELPPNDPRRGLLVGGDHVAPPKSSGPDGNPPPRPGDAPPDARGPGGGPPEPPDGWPGGEFHHGPPMALYDANMTRIAGDDRLPPDAVSYPLKVAGRNIGTLRLASPVHLLYAVDQQFQSQQMRMTWLIVGLAGLLAAGIAVILARLLLAPVQRLVSATERLAGGDYKTRLDETGSDELHRLARDFNRLAQALESNEVSRRNFIADISHELRTPLAVLRGELEAIEDGVRTPNAGTLASLQAEVRLLGKLIDDLYELSLADIGALSFRMVRVNLVPLVESAADAFRERFEARRITLAVDTPQPSVVMQADPHRFAQLMNNLLENSLRYTDPDGQARISISSTPESLDIDIQDSYPDVPDAALPRLFDRLFRVDASRHRQTGGAGLGLALCEHIVREHGGTIRAAHSPLGGLWIMIRFPPYQPA
jgi:two-component system, OmpR family, sensor histidine kinase BaeS